MKKYCTKFLALITLVFFAGCDKFFNVNRDPARPDASLATPDILFPPAVMNSAGRIGGELTIIGGMWSQFYTQSPASNQYKTIDAYNLQNSDFNANYSYLFASALGEYEKVISLSKEQKKWSFYLMATLMKAYTYQVLVDLYDQVPYTEAFKGLDNLTPKFDDGYSIYVGLLKEIDNALAKDQSEYTSPASEKKTDLVFGGNLNKWVSFANTLKLKMYLRMINAKPTEAENGIKKLYADEADFLDEPAGILTFSNTVDKQNPFYAYNKVKLNTGDNLRASKTFVSWLTTNADPRVLTFYGKANPVVMDQGDNLGSYPTAPDVLVQSATDPVHFFSKAESLFMQAEARVRYFGGNGAKDLYDAGVAASFADCGQTAGNLLTGRYKFPTTQADQIEAIIVQKWASLAYGCHALEAFFEKNRTGFPRTSSVYSTSENYVPGQLVYSITGLTGAGNFPKRLLFPNVESSRNPKTPAQVPITTKVWWGL